MKVILNVIALVSAAILGVVIGLILNAKLYGVPVDDTKFKKFIEAYGLNLLGDSLSGTMGLVTLLVVIASLALQMQSARETVKEMKDQNNVAKAVARANYKFALFDKRMAIFTEFGEDLLATGATGSFDRDIYHRLLKASMTAKNLFFSDSKISEWADNMITAARVIMIIDVRIRELEEKQSIGEFGEVDQNNLGKHRVALAKAQNDFRKAYNWTDARKFFLPYLQLDSEITFVDDEKELNQLHNKAA